MRQLTTFWNGAIFSFFPVFSPFLWGSEERNYNLFLHHVHKMNPCADIFTIYKNISRESVHEGQTFSLKTLCWNPQSIKFWSLQGLKAACQSHFTSVQQHGKSLYLNADFKSRFSCWTILWCDIGVWKDLKRFLNVSRFGVTFERSIAQQQLVHPAVRYGF